METLIAESTWSPLIRAKYLPKDCIQCGGEFFSYPSSNRKLCSSSCRAKYTAIKYDTQSRFVRYSGSSHYNWKGGVTSTNRNDRARFASTMQKKILSRDNYTCQECKKHGGSLQVDHIKKWSDFPKLRFVESNCRTLCMACHYFITFKRIMPEGLVWGHNLSRRIA